MAVARVHGKNAAIVANSLVINADVRGYSSQMTCALSPSEAVGDGGNRFMPGQLGGTFSIDAYYGSNAASAYTAMSPALGTSNGYLITALPEGAAVLVPAIMLVGTISGLPLSTQVKQLTMATVTTQPDNGIDWGVLLHGTAAETADNTTSVHDNGASSANGLATNLHVTAFSGLTSAAVKLQSSPDNSSWSDYATFTTATGLTYQQLVTTGAVPRYIRGSLHVVGTGSVSFYLAYARR